uniref:Uncharacterized protein n=1 Tax=Micrurus spixii TaxID=129469 RepID=A0A2D4NAJ4_9SAUR
MSSVLCPFAHSLSHLALQLPIASCPHDRVALQQLNSGSLAETRWGWRTGCCELPAASYPGLPSVFYVSSDFPCLSRSAHFQTNGWVAVTHHFSFQQILRRGPEAALWLKVLLQIVTLLCTMQASHSLIIMLKMTQYPAVYGPRYVESSALSIIVYLMFYFIS